MMAGMIADLLGYPVLFFAATAISGVAVIVTFRLLTTLKRRTEEAAGDGRA